MFRGNRRFLIATAVFLLFAAIFFTGRLTRVSATDELERKLEIYLRALEVVQSEYLEKDVSPSKLIYGSIKGMLESLDDPYTRFMEPSAFKEMNIRMSGSYSGIGIYIGVREKQIVVVSPISDTPAAKAGLKSLDKVLSIDGKITKDMALDEAVGLIRGHSGTTVKLNILRTGWKEPKEFPIVREKIVIKSVESKSMDKGIYYIKLNTFENQNAPQEMRKAINQAKASKAKGIILDLRNNGGGLLRIAIDVGSMFIEDGVIVYTVDREGRRETLSSSGDIIWDRPLVVLVNEASASASEILAGALQDNKAATLVGTHTFGKACVQNVRELDDGSAILITVAKYYTPNGRDITKTGIQPDVSIEALAIPTEEAETEITIPEEEDVQLKKAIEVLKNKSS
jgi:carboxyl-terminal processing protease